MEKQIVPEFSDKTILRKAQRNRNVTQAVIADRIGMKLSALSGNMNRNRMSLVMFSRILAALDYDVVIQDRETGEVVYKLDTEPLLDDDI